MKKQLTLLVSFLLLIMAGCTTSKPTLDDKSTGTLTAHGYTVPSNYSEYSEDISTAFRQSLVDSDPSGDRVMYGVYGPTAASDHGKVFAPDGTVGVATETQMQDKTITPEMFNQFKDQVRAGLLNMLATGNNASRGNILESETSITILLYPAFSQNENAPQGMSVTYALVNGKYLFATYRHSLVSRQDIPGFGQQAIATMKNFGIIPANVNPQQIK